MLLRARTPAVRSESERAGAGPTAGGTAVRDAQQGDRDGRAPLSQERLIATVFSFFRQIAYRGLAARWKTPLPVAAEVTRLKFPRKQKRYESLLTSAATF